MTLPHFNLRSKAFRAGLLDGFTAHYLFFAEQDYQRARLIDASIGGAWKRVGSALSEAEIFERGDLGKSSRKRTKKEAAAA